MRGDAILSEMFLGSFASRISISLSRVHLMELSSVLRWEIESLRLLSMMAQYSVRYRDPHVPYSVVLRCEERIGFLLSKL